MCALRGQKPKTERHTNQPMPIMSLNNALSIKSGQLINSKLPPWRFILNFHHEGWTLPPQRNHHNMDPLVWDD